MERRWNAVCDPSPKGRNTPEIGPKWPVLARYRAFWQAIDRSLGFPEPRVARSSPTGGVELKVRTITTLSFR